MTDRDCPRCWTRLESVQRDVLGAGGTVDACPDCGGVYLDEGALVALGSGRDLDRVLYDSLAHQAPTELACPGCGGKVEAHQLGVGPGSHVDLDVCVECRGVWLDGSAGSALETGLPDLGDLDVNQLADLGDGIGARDDRSPLARRLSRLQG